MKVLLTKISLKLGKLGRQHVGTGLIYPLPPNMAQGMVSDRGKTDSHDAVKLLLLLRLSVLPGLPGGVSVIIRQKKLLLLSVMNENKLM